MYGRKAIFKTVNPNSRKTLTEFLHGISANSMYDSMTTELIATEGFVRKDLIIIDDKTGCVAFSRVIFETKEEFDTHIGDDVYQMIWEYLQISADGVGIVVTFEDGEINTL